MDLYTLDPNDFFHWSLGGAPLKSIKGVVAFKSTPSQYDATVPAFTDRGTFFCVGKDKVFEELGKHGTILPISWPSWLNNPMDQLPKQQIVRGANNAKGLNAEQVIKVKLEAANRGEIDKATGEVADSYLKMKTFEYIFQGRVATLNCPLRFDIAPGSTIRFEMPSISGKSASEGRKQIFVGCVRAVNQGISVNGGTGISAETNLSLTHVRTLEEQEAMAQYFTGHYLFNDPGKLFTKGSLYDIT